MHFYISPNGKWRCVCVYTRKPCCGRETARCRCKVRYAEASRGSFCDSTTFLFIGVALKIQVYPWLVGKAYTRAVLVLVSHRLNHL